MGYDDLVRTGTIVLQERTFRLTHFACQRTVPFLLLSNEFDLDKADLRLGDDGRRQAPHSIMQEYLNANDSALWGLISNGSKLRILRDNPSLTRPSYIEIDLDLVFEEDLYPDFAAFWLTAHSSRLMPREDKPSRCIIESWRTKAQETGQRVRENLRDGVTDALRHFGNGFLCHPASIELRNMLEAGNLSSQQYFQQLLRLIYRLLFLFTAEERDLLHTADATDKQREMFADGYALARVRERALRRRHYDKNRDLWECLKITFDALAKGADGLGLPALGGLFRDGECPDLTSAAITNEHLLEAIRSLAFFPSGNSLVRVNYRDMDTEELGSVYESLLELHPMIDVDVLPWTFSFVGDSDGYKAKGSARKLTGSYYTPPPLVGELIRSTLDPVIMDVLETRPEDPRKALLNLKVIDPACGSGHFLLAAARRIAAEIACLEAGVGTPDEGTRRHALREVVRHCIYGVDRNPLAVDLCKIALWIETVDPGKPLTFLDSHILLGDSLIGMLNPDILTKVIPDDAYKSLTSDTEAVCKDLRQRNRHRGQGDLLDRDAVIKVAVSSLDFDAMPEETLEDVERKRTIWNDARQNEARTHATLRADLFVGAYFAQKTANDFDIIPVTDDIFRLDRQHPQRPGVDAFVRQLAKTHRFHHWPIAFAEIIEDGGFDVVLGNPPWEVSQLNEEEFFATKSPRIADLAGEARKQAIIQLKIDDYQLWSDYQLARRDYEARNNFCRNGLRFTLSTFGKLNSYALFAETFLHLLNPRGRAGLIVPTGIATDDSTKKFFNHIVSNERLVSLFDFENREAVFPGVHRSYKFCLLTLSGEECPVSQAEFAFFLHQVEQLKDRERRFTLSANDFSVFNPNTHTCPIFRTRRDMEIARKMWQKAGILWKERRGTQSEENPWGISFMQMFNMTSDSGLFRTREQLTEAGWMLEGNVFVRGEDRYLPLYEAKLFHQYDHRFATFDDVSQEDIRKGNARNMTETEKSKPDSVVIPRYWVPEQEVHERLDKRKKMTLPPPPKSYSTDLPNWLASRFPENHQRNERANRGLRDDSACRSQRFRNFDADCLLAFRGIVRSTDQRTTIFAITRTVAMSNSTPLVNINSTTWLQAFRGITTSTNERTCITGSLPRSGVGNSAPVIDVQETRAVASALMLANMNSLPLDWVTRLSVGGSNMNFFIVKQLPVLPPEAFIQESPCGLPWVQLIVPRVLQLTYTAKEMEGFAMELGYSGPSFPWDENHRHCLQSELDAIFALMYGLSRQDLEWILDAPSPGSSFPALKQNEFNKFGEYRTGRLVLKAFEMLEQRMVPELKAES